jgi:hypothetical protein
MEKSNAEFQTELAGIASMFEDTPEYKDLCDAYIEMSEKGLIVKHSYGLRQPDPQLLRGPMISNPMPNAATRSWFEAYSSSLGPVKD